MEVEFTTEQIAQLSQLASHHGKNAAELVQEAALRLLRDDEEFRAGVRRGIAQADRGELIEEAEMHARLEQMLRR